MSNYLKIPLGIVLLLAVALLALNLFLGWGGGEVPEGWTDLHQACRLCKYDRIVFDLHSGADPNAGAIGKGYQTPLMELFAGDDCPDREKCLDVLIQNRAKIDSKGSNGTQVIHFPWVLHSTRNVDMLLDHGANVNAVDQLGNTPLHILCSELRHETDGIVVRHLIKKGANLSLKNRAGETPLDAARKANRGDLAQILEDVENAKSEK